MFFMVLYGAELC